MTSTIHTFPLQMLWHTRRLNTVEERKSLTLRDQARSSAAADEQSSFPESPSFYCGAALTKWVGGYFGDAFREAEEKDLAPTEVGSASEHESAKWFVVTPQQCLRTQILFPRETPHWARLLIVSIQRLESSRPARRSGVAASA